uniref:Uncharacterized protein n=1 Tax=Romanomermis culicivorax TaxID=13658 RepID=A0A915IBX4_ROMCU
MYLSIAAACRRMKNFDIVRTAIRRLTVPYGVKYSSQSSGAVRHVRRNVAAQCGAVRQSIAGPLV